LLQSFLEAIGGIANLFSLFQAVIRATLFALADFLFFSLYFFQQAGTELCSVPCLESLDLWLQMIATKRTIQ